MKCLVNIWADKNISQMLDTTQKTVYRIVSDSDKIVLCEDSNQYIKVRDHIVSID